MSSTQPQPEAPACEPLAIPDPALVPGDSALAHALRRLEADPAAVDPIANHDSYM